MYEEFSADYDRFVNWPARLAAEMPFLEEQLESIGAKSVLDTACGTGMHAIALASEGYSVVAADASQAMVAVGRRNAERAGVGVSFVAAPFGDLASLLGTQFDAVLCLGNSLPHVTSVEALDAALVDFRACLRPGGAAVVQSRNFDGVVARQDRWMGPQGHDEEDAERLFVRFYDFEPDGLLTFNVITLRRDRGGSWDQRVSATRLWPQSLADIDSGFTRTGFRHRRWYGDMQGNPFDPASSLNLVAVAQA